MIDFDPLIYGDIGTSKYPEPALNPVPPKRHTLQYLTYRVGYAMGISIGNMMVGVLKVKLLEEVDRLDQSLQRIKDSLEKKIKPK